MPTRVRSIRSLAAAILLGVGLAVGLLGPPRPTPAAPAPLKRPRPAAFVNSLEMKLVRIMPGKFAMGSPSTEQDRSADEQQHEVEITRPFYLGAHEVTQGQYKKVMGNNPSHFSPAAVGQVDGKTLDTADFPVEMVSWNDAVAFCKKLSNLSAEKSKGWRYRLPTEAEWEYACRAGSTGAYHYGKAMNKDQANFDHALGRTCKVGSYRPNGFGLYDMHGNVYEWCQDYHSVDYYTTGPRKDPPGPPTGDTRIYRGGNFGSVPRFCRSAYRTSTRPGATYTGVGFRVACIAANES